MSSGGQSANAVVGTMPRPESEYTGWVSFHTRWTLVSGTRWRTSNGPVRSSWVSPGNSSMPMWSVMGRSWLLGAVAAMTEIRYFLPMARSAVQRAVIVGFDGLQTAGGTRPAEGFAAASRAAGRTVYRVVIASVGGGERTTSCGMIVRTADLRRIRPGRRD